jgi:N-formylglutamate amidohydrolase
VTIRPRKIGESIVGNAPAVAVHIPHASTHIPENVRGRFLLSDAELQAEVGRITDHFTDELFGLPADRATTVRFPVSRLVVDPERFEDDRLEPMSARGMGVIYTRTSLQTPLRDPPGDREREDLLERFYRPHHRDLTAVVDRALERHGSCLVIDGHSFPASPLPYEYDQDPNRPDICIGTDAFHTPDWLRELAREEFRALGYAVQIDRPFAGALVPQRHYRSDPRVRAVMVEINRGLYMTEVPRVARLARFDALRGDLQKVLQRLIHEHES